MANTRVVSLPDAPEAGPSSFPSFVTEPGDPSSALVRVLKAVNSAKRVAVVVGAGISTAAEIPDFRSSTGLFASLKARFPDARLTSGKDLFDVSAWKDPNTLGLHLSMLAELHQMCDEAEPTRFHKFLKRLDEDGKLSRVYTQNIDGLELKSGLTYGVPDSQVIAQSKARTRKAPPSPSISRKRKRNEPDLYLPPPTPRHTPPLASISQSDTESELTELDVLEEQYNLKRIRAVSPSVDSVASSSQTSNSKLAPPTPAATPKPRAAGPSDPFPRAIPLHGDLRSITCPTCKHSEAMADHLESLAEGLAIPCPECSDTDEARTAAGFRARGVAYLKSEVVLYGEEHEAGDRVGAVTSRDLGKGRRPDLLIVAGTTLKIPGTKRLVRELSKVIRPPPKREIGPDGNEVEVLLPEEKRPVHTIFLNAEFPAPAAQWKETFDVWVRGDIQEFIRLVEEDKERLAAAEMVKAMEKLERERRREEREREKEKEKLAENVDKHREKGVGKEATAGKSKARAKTTESKKLATATIAKGKVKTPTMPGALKVVVRKPGAKGHPAAALADTLAASGKDKPAATAVPGNGLVSRGRPKRAADGIERLTQVYTVGKPKARGGSKVRGVSVQVPVAAVAAKGVMSQ